MKIREVSSRILAALSLALVASTAAAGTSSQLETLGANDEYAERAARIESRSRVAVVQSRTVPRNWRFELGANYGPVAAGDPYMNTQNLGGEIHLHATPHFSLGVRYAKMINSLSQESRESYDRAREARRVGAVDPVAIPAIDYPEQSVMGIANWYMTYGKINFFDIRTVQFDIYSLAGYGQMTLSSGTTPTWTAGGGIGFWLAKHLTSRFEVRYQNYSDQPEYGSSRDLHLIIGTFGLGVLL